MKIKIQDANIISKKSSTVLDYFNDFKALSNCKNLKNIDNVKVTSKTDMGEGFNENELKIILDSFRLKYKFDTVLLILLRYVLHNMSYELTEGLYNFLPNNTKLPKYFFSEYEIRCTKTHDAINKILVNYSNESAIALLKIAEGDGPYLNINAGKKDPGSLVIKYLEYWMGSSFEYLFNQLSTKEGIQERLDICERNY
jgi:hypothetical protein